MRRPALFLVLSAAVLSSLAAADRPDGKPPEWHLPPGEAVTQVAVAQDDGEDVIDWGVAAVGAPAAWKNGVSGKGVTVAVLDTGCDPRHRDLKGAIKAGKDFTGSSIGWSDFNRHGTHCAGTIAARHNGWGLVGVAPDCQLLIAKVLSDSGSGGVDWIRDGGLWAISQGADVLSMSLGGPAADTFIPQMLARAEAEGVIVIAAAGNEGPGEGTCGYPGRYKECVAVAAVDGQRQTARFSSRCTAVYVAAPGVQIQSTLPGKSDVPDGLFGLMSGTSMATPHVAGIAALWVQANPNVPKKERPAKFREWLRAACTDLAPAGRDTATGFGFPSVAGLKVDGTAPPPARTPILFLEDLTPEGRKRLADALKN